MIVISATRRAVNTAANIQKVNCTEADEIAEIAARVGIRPSMIHGWRPTSAVTQPASEHIHTMAIESIDSHCHQRRSHSLG